MPVRTDRGHHKLNGEAKTPANDDVLAERCERYEVERAVCVAFGLRRFPVDSIAILPRELGGLSGVVMGVVADDRVRVKVLVMGRVYYPPLADMLRINPPQHGA